MPLAAFPIMAGELRIAPTAFLIPTNILLQYGCQGLLCSQQCNGLDFDGGDVSLARTNAQDAVLGGGSPPGAPGAAPLTCVRPPGTILGRGFRRVRGTSCNERV